MELGPRPPAPPTGLASCRFHSSGHALPSCWPSHSTSLVTLFPSSFWPHCSLLCPSLSSLLASYVSLLSPFAFSSGFRYFHSLPSVWCLSSVLHISFSLSSLASFPCPSPLMSFSSPTPPYLAKSPGETSKDKQTAATSLYWLISLFSSSHKGHHQHGSNSGLTWS